MFGTRFTRPGEDGGAPVLLPVHGHEVNGSYDACKKKGTKTIMVFFLFFLKLYGIGKRSCRAAS